MRVVLTCRAAVPIARVPLGRASSVPRPCSAEKYFSAACIRWRASDSVHTSESDEASPASCAVPAEPARLALSSTLRVTVAKQTSSSRAEPDNVHILYAEPMIARRQNHLPPSPSPSSRPQDARCCVRTARLSHCAPYSRSPLTASLARRSAHIPPARTSSPLPTGAHAVRARAAEHARASIVGAALWSVSCPRRMRNRRRGAALVPGCADPRSL